MKIRFSPPTRTLEEKIISSRKESKDLIAEARIANLLRSAAHQHYATLRKKEQEE